MMCEQGSNLMRLKFIIPTYVLLICASTTLAAEPKLIVEDYAIFESCAGPRDTAEFVKYQSHIEELLITYLEPKLSSEYYGAVVGAVYASGERCFWLVDRIGKHDLSVDKSLLAELRKLTPPAITANQGCDLPIFPFAINFLRGLDAKKQTLPSDPPIPLQWKNIMSEMGSSLGGSKITMGLDHVSSLACPRESAK